jgi:hypothetical protein
MNKEVIYVVDAIDRSKNEVHLSRKVGRNIEKIVESIDNIEFIGFNKLWCVIKNK